MSVVRGLQLPTSSTEATYHCCRYNIAHHMIRYHVVRLEAFAAHPSPGQSTKSVGSQRHGRIVSSFDSRWCVDNCVLAVLVMTSRVPPHLTRSTCTRPSQPWRKCSTSTAREPKGTCLPRIMIGRRLVVSMRPLTVERVAKRRRSQSVTRSDYLGQPIIALDQAVLSYPGEPENSIGPLHLSIKHPSTGGHVLLGKNGSGKSLIAYTLASLVDDEQASTYIRSGSYSTEDNWHRRAVAKVSFQSHEQLLTRGGTVSKTISDGGNLSKAAKFLIVRFGLYHHLHREVHT